ncbi:hypothetical protein THRCLA_03248 [Thraustotheca clavata]|uniref:EF-hand domain-containing protein n=1 Tax=Thraustotheca clavata TaxID=74557 RepID=A0A1W0A2L0_9STRA|nr:hypothetical protein THRCLA_03248 [Thraustotheca clavata]
MTAKSPTGNSCLDIMMRLKINDLNALKEDFEAYGDVNLDGFVTLLLERLEWTEANVVELVHELIDLFNQIVINGRGIMVWDDFTSAMIEMGMRANISSNELPLCDMRYEENLQFVDTISRHPRCIQYIPELKRILIYDGNRPVLQVFDAGNILSLETSLDGHDDNHDANSLPTLPYLHEVHPLSYQSSYRKDQDEVRSERSPVQTVKYLTKMDIVVIAAGDLKMTFWNPIALLSAENPKPIHITETTHPQRIFEWAPQESRLFSIATDNLIIVWTITTRKKKSCSVTKSAILDAHRDIVQDLLLVNDDTLVSCGMDSLILIWDSHTLQCKSTRRGHKRGVRKLTKHSNSVFVSAGFEMDMLGWDVSGLSSSPIFKLAGHLAPVLDIQMVPHQSQAISVDEDGWFKWWNMTNLMAMDDGDRCLQTFRFGQDKYPWKPNSFTMFLNGETLLATGYHIKWIHRVRLKPRNFPSAACLFNQTTCTVLTTTDRDICIWDAVKGNLVQTFRGLSRTDITNVVLDTHERKFIVTNLSGDIYICNYLNGSLIKNFPKHAAPISCLEYCKEDRCVLTASLDRCLRLYDDDSNKPLLRSITDAHESDIKCIAFSYHLGLIATGSTDGTMKIWDYIYFLLEQSYREFDSDVTAVAFIDPYPIIVSGYDNGMIVLHTVRPVESPQWIFQFQIDSTSPTGGSVTSLQIYYDVLGGEAIAEGISTGRQLLYVGDQIGILRCWDIYPVLCNHNIQAADEDKLPHTSKTYHPRRRIIREDKRGAPRDFIAEPPPIIYSWQAHQMAIKRCSIVNNPIVCLLTCSLDKTTKVWAVNGTLLGIVGASPSFWQLNADTTIATEHKWANAVALWDRLKIAKNDKVLESFSKTRINRHRSMPSLNSPLMPLELDERDEKELVLGQLHGEETWKKSDIQVARELAWSIEAEKYKTRMQRIFKQPIEKKSEDEQFTIPIPHQNVLDSLAVDQQSENALLTTLPPLSSNQLSQMSFENKDNWTVNSLNRQKQIYNNLYSETTRNQRNLQIKKVPKLLNQVIDTNPSSFILEHLGPDIVLKKHIKKRENAPLSLSSSKSTPTLSHQRQDKNRRVSSVRLEKMQHNHIAAPLDVIIQNAKETLKTKSSPTRSMSVLNPQLTLEKYGGLFQDDDKVQIKPLKQHTKRKTIHSTTHIIVPTSTSQTNQEIQKNTYSIRDVVESDRQLLHQAFFGPYPREHVLEVVKIFVRIDVDNSGVIETNEFIDKMMQMKEEQADDTLYLYKLYFLDIKTKFLIRVFNQLDQDHNGQLDMPEVIKAVFPHANTRVRDEMLRFAKLAIAAERNERANTKELSAQAIADITSLFHMFDIDHNGSIEPIELLKEFKMNEKLYYNNRRSSEVNPTLATLGKWQLEDIMKIFQLYDVNANASLELPEFIELFRDTF